MSGCVLNIGLSSLRRENICYPVFSAVQFPSGAEMVSECPGLFGLDNIGKETHTHNNQQLVLPPLSLSRYNSKQQADWATINKRVFSPHTWKRDKRAF
jgi:hypothetical protein